MVGLLNFTFISADDQKLISPTYVCVYKAVFLFSSVYLLYTQVQLNPYSHVWSYKKTLRNTPFNCGLNLFHSHYDCHLWMLCSSVFATFHGGGASPAQGIKQRTPFAPVSIQWFRTGVSTGCSVGQNMFLRFALSLQG